MEYTEAIADIKRRVPRIKTQLDNANMSNRSANLAVNDALARLNRIQLELANLEKTLKEFVGEPRPAAKVGPSETK